MSWNVLVAVSIVPLLGNSQELHVPPPRERLNASVLRTHLLYHKELQDGLSIGMFPCSILTERKYKLHLNV